MTAKTSFERSYAAACVLAIVCVAITLAVVGCGSQPAGKTAGNKSDKKEEAVEQPADSPNGSGTRADGTPMTLDPDSIEFRDQVVSNAEIPDNLEGLVFTSATGEPVDLSLLLGEKNLVLVVAEGFTGEICVFCTTQTSRLVANFDAFQALDAEIILIYPGNQEQVEQFVAASSGGRLDRIPFEVVLDQEMDAVRFFGIESNLAHPSTFIIDKSKNVRLAYVGADMSADRPSIEAMLNVLRLANE